MVDFGSGGQGWVDPCPLSQAHSPNSLRPGEGEASGSNSPGAILNVKILR
jgi:hypothetical protein